MRLPQKTAAIPIALLLAACGSSTASPSAPAGGASPSTPTGEGSPSAAAVTPAPEPATISVALNWPVPEYTHTGITMAEARGYYDEENLAVELLPLDGSSASVQAVGAGSANVGFAGAGAILAGISEGAPILVVANHLQSTPTGVLYQPEHEIDAFEDLRGLSIATQSTGEDTVNLYAFLRNAGLDPETDVDIQVVDGAIKCTLLLTKTVDACTGFSTGHLVRAHAEDPNIKFLPFRTPELQPIGHSVIVNSEWLASNEDVLRRFLRATYRGYLEADGNLEELAQTYSEKYPEEGVDLYLESAIEAHKLMHSERTEQHGWGYMVDKPWADLQALLLEAGTITSETPASEIYTNDYLPEDAEF